MHEHVIRHSQDVTVHADLSQDDDLKKIKLTRLAPNGTDEFNVKCTTLSPCHLIKVAINGKNVVTDWMTCNKLYCIK